MSQTTTNEAKSKKKSLIATEQESPRVKNLRHQFRRWLDKVDLRNLVFIDETGVNQRMVRKHGRSKAGERVYDNRPGAKGKNTTLIGAMSDEGLIATMTLPGSLDTQAFIVYVREILIKNLWPGAIVVMDNLPVHYSKTATALIESVGAQVKFLPPYSPDLSPIELCWSKIKGILCSERATTDSQLDIAITKAINEISEENAMNWFNHCGLYSEAIF